MKPNPVILAVFTILLIASTVTKAYADMSEKMTLQLISAENIKGDHFCQGPTAAVKLSVSEKRFKIGRSKITIQRRAVSERQSDCDFTYNITR